METEQILRKAYRAFNARDIAQALAVMHPEVDWPNGMQGVGFSVITLSASTGPGSGDLGIRTLRRFAS